MYLGIYQGFRSVMRCAKRKRKASQPKPCSEIRPLLRISLRTALGNKSHHRLYFEKPVLAVLSMCKEDIFLNNSV